MPWRLLEYNALIAHRERKPVRSVLVLLNRPEPAESRLLLAWEAGSPYLSFRFEIVRLYETPASDLAVDASLAALTPLGQDFSGVGQVELAAETLRRVGEPERAERLFVLSLLARARGVDGGLVRAIIQDREVRMSLAYQEILDEGCRLMVRNTLGRRFAGHESDLDDLLNRCSVEDLSWLQDEMYQIKRFSTLRAHLEKRLGGRGSE